ncbi:hypothetical protein E4U47_004714 [Claviceps purpurea]|nr:hypothetical protein E4U36_003385 [Claviceps purpurea]KAG6268331.1 hypothetical protein E4U47_004714 [Claviceps purpurea]
MSSPNSERSQKKAEADLCAQPWVDRMLDEMRSANPKAARFPYTELRYEVYTARAASAEEMGKNAYLLNSTGAGDGEAQSNETLPETSQAQGGQTSSGQ